MHSFQIIQHYNQIGTSTILDIIISLLSLFVTTAAAISAYFSYRVIRDTFKDSINRLYFDIRSNVSNPPTASDISKICDYFEYICRLKRRKKLNSDDLELQSELMRLPNLITFVKTERIKNKNSEIYREYWSWLKEKRLV